ncbi:RcnB family protein [Dyella sedimenti]|uniref:RcnB family protein n=1 Tax=Dyella sedimenti TaxID=2919947 RepID=UPI001FA997F5|nr:RcnB family protein [Dyella sedimenti]
MKKTLIALVLAGLVASASVAASPIQYDDHHDHDRSEHDRDHDRHDNVIVHDRGVHEGWYRRGGYVPAEYRDHRYVVDDWHNHHLRQPPRGYQWVRSDTGDFLLVAVTTGLIADMVLSH